jgi:hypothetical protein
MHFCKPLCTSTLEKISKAYDEGFDTGAGYFEAIHFQHCAKWDAFTIDSP